MWLELANFLHFIGIAWGVGGATIATIISIKGEKDSDVAKASMKIMPAISKLIMLGLIFLIISGIALIFLVKWPIDRNMLIIKHILVALVVIFGVGIAIKSKKLGKLAPKSSKDKLSKVFLKTKKQVKILSIINLILWYLIILQSVFI